MSADIIEPEKLELCEVLDEDIDLDIVQKTLEWISDINSAPLIDLCAVTSTDEAKDFFTDRNLQENFIDAISNANSENKVSKEFDKNSCNYKPPIINEEFEQCKSDEWDWYLKKESCLVSSSCESEKHSCDKFDASTQNLLENSKTRGSDNEAAKPIIMEWNYELVENRINVACCAANKESEMELLELSKEMLQTCAKNLTVFESNKEPLHRRKESKILTSIYTKKSCSDSGSILTRTNSNAREKNKVNAIIKEMEHNKKSTSELDRIGRGNLKEDNKLVYESNSKKYWRNCLLRWSKEEKLKHDLCGGNGRCKSNKHAQYLLKHNRNNIKLTDAILYNKSSNHFDQCWSMEEIALLPTSLPKNVNCKSNVGQSSSETIDQHIEMRRQQTARASPSIHGVVMTEPHKEQHYNTGLVMSSLPSTLSRRCRTDRVSVALQYREM